MTTHTAYSLYSLPAGTLLRLAQIVSKKNAPGILPIARSTFLGGVASGRYPKPIKLGPRAVAWRADELRAAVEAIAA